MSQPKVSVLMATYNAMPFLPPAVDSILGQTFADFQFVIVDDGSTDDSHDYLNSLDDARIKLVQNKNSGLSAALNRGIQECAGEYVARMDADDISMPNRLAVQVDFLDRRPDISCVGTQVVPFGDSGSGSDLRLPTQHREIVQCLKEGRHAIVHASAMMRLEVLQKIGGYWPYRLVAEDYDLFLRMSEVAELATIDEVLYQVRYHMSSLNGQDMLRMRRAVDFAGELARRRGLKEPPLTFDEFVALRKSAPWPKRVSESLDAYARVHYRIAMGELCSGKRTTGYLRMGWAAACSPSLTLQRMLRVIKPASSKT